MITHIAYILVLVGALNWGLVGLGSLIGMDLNVVSLVFGFVPYLESIIYVVVGASALRVIFSK